MAADPSPPRTPSDPSQDAALEEIVAEFLLEREEGRNPSIDDYLTRYPKHAEALAQLLTYDTHPPARRDSTRPRGPEAPSDALRLGPYEVIEHVSTAGGGTVYRARHREGGHLVALKVLDSRGAVDPRDIERFHREAAMLRALNLVHVVPVLDAGEDGGRSWIAMKWLEGDTFSKLREAAADKSHRLYDLRERARLVARVARTFAAIHGYGILHRDVKPTNIMVDTTGEPMIIDFGIAQAPDLPELTTTIDQVMGTPRFLAPELLSGGNRQVSPRTDVYGLGLCLYELCTGVEAFKQEVRADLFTAIRTTGPTHPRKANPALSHDFAAVILRSIEIDPARRYPDMATFADDLDHVARGESPEPATLRGANPLLRTVRRHKKRIIAAACLAAVLIPAAWLVTKRGLDTVRARDLETKLRPFAWFAPEAFAGGVGVPAAAVAGELASNAAATPEQHMAAAWINFLSGNVKQALGCLPAEDQGFASRLLRAHLGALKDASTTVHSEADLPLRGEHYEALIPMEVAAHTIPLTPERFDALLKGASERGPPVTPLDELILATLKWTLVSNDPKVDTKEARGAIMRLLARPAEAPETRLPALHLRGVMKFLAGDTAGAVADFSEVVGTRREAVGTRYLLAMAMMRAGDGKAARKHLEIVAREIPRNHPARSRVLGHLALARAADEDHEKALDACREWWTDCRNDRQWQDSVIPRVLAAQLLRERGELVQARDLLLAAVREDQAFRVREMRRQGPDAYGRITLWEPALRAACAVAEAMGDPTMVEELQDKMDSVNLQPVPASPEAYLAINLGGLRAHDFRPAVEAAPKNQ